MKSQNLILYKKSFDLIMLVIGLCVWIIAYILFNHQIIFQMILVLTLGVGYVIWGVWHHRKQKIGRMILISEYASMGLLIVALFAGTLLIFRL